MPLAVFQIKCFTAWSKCSLFLNAVPFNGKYVADTGWTFTVQCSYSTEYQLRKEEDVVSHHRYHRQRSS